MPASYLTETANPEIAIMDRIGKPVVIQPGDVAGIESWSTAAYDLAEPFRRAYFRRAYSASWMSIPKEEDDTILSRVREKLNTKPGADAVIGQVVKSGVKPLPEPIGDPLEFDYSHLEID